MDIKTSSEKRFALLIDADNVSSKYIKPITDELSKYGTVTYKRIYGDWTLTLHAKWKDALLENSITPIQQFGYTQGKNATDSAMIIDAMDILYTRSVEGFCIVSSDSDFTRLASRIRESGLTVIGMGEKKTPVPFRKACDIFTTLELLLPGASAKPSSRGKGRPEHSAASNGQNTGPTIEEIEQAVVNIITDNQNNGKSTGVGEVGSRLLKRYPDFDVRSYGTNQLTKLLGEFTRVQIIKDGSSVAIELTETKEPAKEPAKTKAAEPKELVKEPARKPTKAAAKPADQESSKDAVSAAAADAEGSRPEPESASGDAAAKSTARRSLRRRRGQANAQNEGERPAEVAPEETSEPGPEDAAAPEPEPAVQDTAQDGAQPAPRKTTRRGKRGGAKRARTEAAQIPEASEQPAEPRETAAPAASPEPASPEPEPTSSARSAQRRNPRAKRPPASKPAEQQAAKSRQELAQKPQAEAPAAKAPDRFVRQLVRESGAEGIAMSELSKRVRAKHRDFKVRDLGYSQFRSYVADLDDIELSQVGKEFYARLAE